MQSKLYARNHFALPSRGARAARAALCRPPAKPPSGPLRDRRPCSNRPSRAAQLRAGPCGTPNCGMPRPESRDPARLGGGARSRMGPAEEQGPGPCSAIPRARAAASLRRRAFRSRLCCRANLKLTEIQLRLRWRGSRNLNWAPCIPAAGPAVLLLTPRPAGTQSSPGDHRRTASQSA